MRVLIIGTVVTVAAWVLAWSRAGVLSEYSFFPLWLGYILTVNGISEAAFHTSLLRIMRGRFWWLFAGSVPLWWFFEAVNRLVHNWEYVFRQPMSALHYVIVASIDFSTVVPAVLSAAFLACRILHHYAPGYGAGRGWRVSTLLLILSGVMGLAAFLGFWLAPHETFPLVWIAPILRAFDATSSASLRLCGPAKAKSRRFATPCSNTSRCSGSAMTDCTMCRSWTRAGSTFASAAARKSACF